MNHRDAAGDGASLGDRPAVVYRGVRTPSGPLVARVHADATTSRLAARFDLRNHSPDGFEWGYGGSDPAQLALAILADAVGDETAMDYYQNFKFAVIAGFQGDRWELGRADVVA